MAIADTIKRLLGFSLGGLSYLSGMSIPPGWDYQRYLEAYGQVGWLYGAVSLIANSVADSEWNLFKKISRTESEPIEDHPLLDLLDHVNPFQTRYQFFLLMQSYISLIGEAFIVLYYNLLKQPAEMWLFPPGNMTIVPSRENYIDHYEYQNGTEKIRLELPQVIHIMDPNPANPYRGTSAARAVSTDIDADFYASRFQQRIFYNDAALGMIFEFPDTPSPEERKQLRLEMLEAHQGWRNARRPAFLWGGAKVNTITTTPKDLDYGNLRNANKKIILGAYHIPDSLIGASEVGSRARAEADEYIFSKYTIKPALTRIREALNEQLCTLFKEDLKFDYVNPVPADVVTEQTNIRENYKAGLITRQEARIELNREPEAAEGEIYFSPPSVFGLSSPTKSLKLKQGEVDEESHWKAYREKTESQETAFKTTLKTLFDEQEVEVLRRVESGIQDVESVLFNEAESNKRFSEMFQPEIANVYSVAIQDARDNVKPNNPHRAIKQGGDEDFLNTIALEWIRTRSLELAKMVNGTTKEELRKILAEEFSQGVNIDKLTKRLKEFYAGQYEWRAPLVARTEVIAAYNEGNLQGYESEGVEKVQWYAALDERLCDECMAEHEKVYPIIESHGMIPLHPQCRCIWLTYLE